MSAFDDVFSAVREEHGETFLELSEASDRDVSELEKALSVRLPEWYQHFLKDHNPIDAEVNFWRILGIDELEEEHTEAYPGIELLEKGLFMVAVSSGDCFCINVADHSDTALYYYEHDSGACVEKFSTFEDFLWSIVEGDEPVSVRDNATDE